MHREVDQDLIKTQIRLIEIIIPKCNHNLKVRRQHMACIKNTFELHIENLGFKQIYK